MLLGQTDKLKPFVLEGTVKGLHSGYVYLNYISGNAGKLDSAAIQNGNFIIRGYIAEPVRAFFSTLSPWVISGKSNDDNNFTEIYIEPGNMRLNASTNHFSLLTIAGSKSEIEWQEFLSLEEMTNKELKKTQDSISKYKSYLNKIPSNDSIILAGALNKRIDSLYQTINYLDKKYMSIDSGFIVNHPESYVSADLLSQANSRWISFPSLTHLYNNFPRYIQDSYYGKKIKNKINREMHTSIGSIAKDFVALDDKGDTVSLHKYKGKKYVLLDFGASWCSPCRAIIPTLKEEYAKYFPDFTIVSIADQKAYNEWLNFIKKDPVPWPQIFENDHHLPVYPVHNTIAGEYYINSLPSLILIDKNSRIIGKFGGFYSSGPAYMSDLKKQLAGIF
jgi:thiol-disulfide isomerase/thioredoxin